MSFYTLDVFVTIAIFAVAMQLSWKRIGATQFTLYMAFSNLGLAAGGWLMSYLKQSNDWSFVFLVYIFFALFALVVLLFIKLNRHRAQLDELEFLSD